MNSAIREIISLKYDWKFSLEATNEALALDFDDTNWSTVRIPHDWAIKGPFDRRHDAHYTAIEWDGEHEASEHSGRTGALPHVGIGWYRKQVAIPASLSDKLIWLEFDGIMSNSQVFINGHYAGGRPYGYSSFKLDITEFIKFDADNLIAVKVENLPFSSRWYPGAGIYRQVRMIGINQTHIAHWGTYITTLSIAKTTAWVKIKTDVEGLVQSNAELQIVIYDPNGDQVADSTTSFYLNDSNAIETKIQLKNIQCWGINSPRLYSAVSKLYVDSTLTDCNETCFGIRELQFTKEHGFLLNNKPCKLKGVCLHHDLGPMGIAVNRRAIERQLDILLAMGCNAIRTAHNPAAPELLELCDEKGLLVIEEAFDEWRAAKVENGYHRHFDLWAERDLSAMIRRDRNHPCIIMWSIGNEMLEQTDANGSKIAQFLSDICHKIDPSRKTTAGFSNLEAITNGLAAAVDLPGWNYLPQDYAIIHKKYPEWICYGSETMSTISSRGIYHFPVCEERIANNALGHDDLQLSSYDKVTPTWGTTMEVEFHYQEQCPFILGQFVWTGFDYLGEPTPYYRQWPTRSSFFGIIDLSGNPKDRYYMFMSQWSSSDLLHILPHWSWPGREGLNIPIHIYTKFDKVELLLNGKSQGYREINRKSYNLLHHYRLIWDDLIYEPGELKAVAYQNDQPIMEKTIYTAGKPTQISASADREIITGDGEDMCFVNIRITDDQGNFCPNADNQVTVTLIGDGELIALGNGDPTNLEPFQQQFRHCFNGILTAYIRSVANTTGTLIVKLTSPGLKDYLLPIQLIR
jgi:beta-galactosidase